MAMLDVRQVWVVQCRSNGMFLHPDLYLTRSIKEAGKCHDRTSALDTGLINLGDDFQVFDFYELNKPEERY